MLDFFAVHGRVDVVEVNFQSDALNSVLDIRRQMSSEAILKIDNCLEEQFAAALLLILLRFHLGVKVVVVDVDQGRIVNLA